ncbi:phosphatidylinositol glycan anchor biosynthesis class U protein-like isoform X2 [Panicum miliaceum]|uniref:Phosphatidylinositol glycan anchor biosynthesis class U protein-like isoform X2 n=1 Tax=Panicum miliaceum TaxID=4540 RepID=A0A3L6RA44_PANMI|nr:phosphatidylinositol glycan anchor biosynthesis class U protein-like isoform X2 [Panicum miliaceum]
MAIRYYWLMVAAAVGFRLVLVLFGGDLHLASRPEVSTPLTSLRRLAEGYWLKQASMSPYSDLVANMLLFIADFLAAMLIRGTGHRLQMSRNRSLKSLDLTKAVNNSGLAPLAAFGYVMATHLSLYPAILIVPVILLLGYGPDAPPTKVFLVKSSSDSKSGMSEYERTSLKVQRFSWMTVLHFIFWLFIWSCYVLLLSSMILKKVGGLNEMFEKTYGFILTVKDLSPNIGVLWYFFAEVFDFFRTFFLIVFNMNILFMVLPLAIRLKHRPCFLAFVYTAIVAMLKSYPSAGDSALYLGLLGLFANELAEMQFTFFLFFGYIGVSLLSPVMHNLWIWRGTGNANFYFATGLAYTCLQTVLVVESVGSMIKHDRKLRLLVTS